MCSRCIASSRVRVASMSRCKGYVMRHVMRIGTTMHLNQRFMVDPKAPSAWASPEMASFNSGRARRSENTCTGAWILTAWIAGIASMRSSSFPIVSFGLEVRRKEYNTAMLPASSRGQEAEA